jgi:hypothetical protein
LDRNLVLHFKVTIGGLHGKHAVQRGILVPTQHLLLDEGKPRKTLIELAGRGTKLKRNYI